MLQPVAPAAGALAAAASDALLVSAAAAEDLPGAVRDTVVAMRQAHGYYRGGPEGKEGDLQVSGGSGGDERAPAGREHPTRMCCARSKHGGQLCLLGLFSSLLASPFGQHCSQRGPIRQPAPSQLPRLTLPPGATRARSPLQVLSPMRKGPAGTTALNPMLQALLNPPAPGKAELARYHGAAAASPAAAAAAGKVFRVGDRVIQQVNNYDKEVFNGDQGRVRRGAGAAAAKPC